jgi:hypothetical protein
MRGFDKLSHRRTDRLSDRGVALVCQIGAGAELGEELERVKRPCGPPVQSNRLLTHSSRKWSG